MGVPKFYRWLSERYPLINQQISKETLLPDIDNLYLDMNGIIHACSHPADNDFSKTISFREMILGMFRYINRLVTEIVKPKRMLFMAVDGVAPRAKLNQQRSRRFRSAEERTKNMLDAKRRGEMFDENEVFDSNCITPGTTFMADVSRHLQWFIQKKIKEDPIWRNLEIVFSGAEVPGEGEHKIMEYIRDARVKPDYEPNLRHCMCGNDADLIMLALSCHEPHFTLLREVVNFKMQRGGNKNDRQTVIRQTKDVSFQLLHISLLREYISLDLGFGLSWKVNEERIIDDFILMTFLVGNDFLPHLPTLNISENAFDVIMDAYRDVIRSKPNGYITENGEIKDFDQLEKLFSIIGLQEADILANRDESLISQASKKSKYKKDNALTAEEIEFNEEEKRQAFEDALMEALQSDSLDTAASTSESNAVVSVSANSIAAPKDSDRGLSENKKDFRGRFYFEKFSVIVGTAKADSLMQNLFKVYLEGLMWCLGYYVKGCISWTWFYPYHYGPMLQDMKNLQAISTKIHFPLDQPFRPFQQLLGCLPPASKRMLPEPYQWLMTSHESPMIDCYPLEFKITLEHNQNPWEAVVLLPFIDEGMLKECEAKYCPESKLTPEEIKRNSFGKILVYKFDPSATDTVYSCSVETGLEDIRNCQSSIEERDFDITPGRYFAPELVKGTSLLLPGFPSLCMLPVRSFEFAKFDIDVFGMKSKYKSVAMELDSAGFFEEGTDITKLLGMSVYVNYPLVHEARIVAISTKNGEVKLIYDKEDPKKKTIETIKYIPDKVAEWSMQSNLERDAYLKGRGAVGSGGIKLDPITTRIRVQVLQGMSTDPETGVRRKVFGEVEADIPMQLVLWRLPQGYVDNRFQEKAKSTVPELFPYDTEVLCIKGKYKGCLGKVKGPHGPDNKWKGVVSESSTRRLTVEISVPELAEKDFAKAIIASKNNEQYYSLPEVAREVGIDNSLLGRLVGLLVVFDDSNDRWDIGLDFKKNGNYYLLGYTRPVASTTKPQIAAPRPVWKTGDSVKIIGSTNTVDFGVNDDVAQWEYSRKAIATIMDYKKRFPGLIKSLTTMHNEKFLKARDIFKKNSGESLPAVLEWLKCLPCSSTVRNPLSTISIPPDLIQSIERSSDILASKMKQSITTIIAENVPLNAMFRLNTIQQHADIAMNLQTVAPTLGDRVANLNVPSVPPGLRGTVVSVHTRSGFVDVVFDEEFYGGKSLQGSCSDFRGKLCAWSSLIKLNVVPMVVAPATAVSSEPVSASSVSIDNSSATVIPTVDVPRKTGGSSKQQNAAQSLKAALKVGGEPTTPAISNESTVATSGVPQKAQVVTIDSSAESTNSASAAAVVPPAANSSNSLNLTEGMLNARNQLSMVAASIDPIVMNPLFFDDPISFDPFNIPMGQFRVPPPVVRPPTNTTVSEPTSAPTSAPTSRGTESKEKKVEKKKPESASAESKKEGSTNAATSAPKPKVNSKTSEVNEVKEAKATASPPVEKPKKAAADSQKQSKPAATAPATTADKTTSPVSPSANVETMPPPPPSDAAPSSKPSAASLLAKAKAAMKNKPSAPENKVATADVPPPVPSPAPVVVSSANNNNNNNSDNSNAQVSKITKEGAKSLLMEALTPKAEAVITTSVAAPVATPPTAASTATATTSVSTTASTSAAPSASTTGARKIVPLKVMLGKK